MQKSIASIVSEFTRFAEDQLISETVIDRGVIGNSILVHRMYAKLADEGYNVEAYWNIRTYGDLLAQQEGTESVVSSPATIPHNEISGNSDVAIGIDAEEIARFHEVADYREDPFYAMNFSPEEIAYCILQPVAAASFAGLFAAKEAIVKAAPQYAKKPFSSLSIHHLTSGKPVCEGFEISISHTEQLAIAVAIHIPTQPVVPVQVTLPESAGIPRKTAQNILLILSLLLSVAALILALRAIFS